MGQEIRKALHKRFHAACGEKGPMVPCSLNVWRNVAREHRDSVGHGLKEDDGQTFQIGRQHE